jgi:hypothetical protein
MAHQIEPRPGITVALAAGGKFDERDLMVIK